MLRALKDREYRLLWIGQAVSHLGDQFHLVALPWLVLAITHDPLQLGLVLAAAGVPRALVMLFGGAVADRISPRLVMIVSDLVRFAIVGLLAVAVFGGAVQLWMVYALAISFGIVSGFFLPAAEATVPRLLPSAQLESGNSLMMIVDQIASFVGPAAAGTMIALLGGAAGAAAGSPAGMRALGIALGIDAASFAVSAVTLLAMKPLPGLGSDKHPLHDIAEGLRYAWSRPMVRLLVGVIAAANLFATGPLMVGVPVLASQRLSQGAAAYGLIVSAYAFGNLFGMVAAGSLPKLPDRAFVLVSTALFFTFATVYVAFAFLSSTWLAMALMAIVGVGNGYIAVLVITALQRLTPKALLGRVMSLLMLAMYGLAPVSSVLSGAILSVSLAALFLVSAAGFAVIGVVVFANREIWVFPELDDAGNVVHSGPAVTELEPA